MSRVGKMPIAIPSGVSVSIDGQHIKVSGPKGELELDVLDGITVEQDGEQLVVKRANDEALLRARHGLTRALVSNMVVGVSQGFEKKLEINGVGFRVQAQGNSLKFNLGFSHDVNYQVPEGVNVAVEQNVISLSSNSRQQVGQVAAEIRSLKKPEPYKGKGIKYAEERIRRKVGKSGKE